MKIDFFKFAYLWFRLQGMSMPKHQRKMVKWLFGIWRSDDNQRALLMAFRNSGKSTIVGLFCSWVLYQDNSARILVMSADYDLAKKMVRNVKKSLGEKSGFLLKKGIFETSPFINFRWLKAPGEVYGRSPVMKLCRILKP